jgi:hypothetical protein
VRICSAAATGVSALAVVIRKEVVNNDDVSDADDVDLECRRRSAHRAADRGNRKAAKEVRMRVRKTP